MPLIIIGTGKYVEDDDGRGGTITFEDGALAVPNDWTEFRSRLYSDQAGLLRTIVGIQQAQTVSGQEIEDRVIQQMKEALGAEE